MLTSRTASAPDGHDQEEADRGRGSAAHGVGSTAGRQASVDGRKTDHGEEGADEQADERHTAPSTPCRRCPI